ncbi:hypothetical protein DIZ27_31655 [Streptomyces sp. NWU339]|uniref:hypothetical protein n=1 Tax=Streptomyces sp. NWU339 TaxID=2185284 RepID=UPI000D678171|nr:hypothetical protein [Streptomyces sp. NWU339]PWI06761.1 hypothetical protein DIZ27_31655 [Streptomyces sp. NWU339]
MRRIAAVILGAAAFVGFVASPANAVVDPLATVTCLASAAPADLSSPAELPGDAVGCLQP